MAVKVNRLYSHGPGVDRSRDMRRVQGESFIDVGKRGFSAVVQDWLNTGKRGVRRNNYFIAGTYTKSGIQQEQACSAGTGEHSVSSSNMHCQLVLEGLALFTEDETTRLDDAQDRRFYFFVDKRLGERYF